MDSMYSHFVTYFYENNLFKNSSNIPRPAIFADRDGVIIKDKHYLSDVNKVELEDGAYNFLDSAYSLKIPVILVTNQSGIGRGLFTWHDYENITIEMMKKVGKCNPIIAIFANGTLPNAPNYSWRKPSPEMIYSASKLLDINISKSILIGDRLTDIQCGANAGILNLIHLKTGHGTKEIYEVERFIENTQIFTNKNNKFKIKFNNNIGDIDLYDYPFLK